MTVFSFAPLSDDPFSVRLVQIHGFDKDGYVECSVHHNVLERGKFLALSHVWGSENPTFKINIDGSYLWVRPNLWSFLTYATTSFAGANFWIDALCIDQDNLAEKNRQIPLMHQIFSRATKVISWLHGDPCGSLRYSASDKRDPNVSGPQLLSKVITEQSALRADSADIDTAVAALVRLIGHEYWSRLWIVQELQFAQEVEIHWACQTIDWIRLKSTAYVIMHGSVQGSDYIRLMANRLRKGPWQIHGSPFLGLLEDVPKHNSPMTHALQSQLKDPATLLNLVLHFRNHSCSMYHDRIYALVALAVNGSDFVADYSESRVSLLARLLSTENGNHDLEVTESIGRMLNIDLEEWIRFQAIAVKNAGCDQFVLLDPADAKLFNQNRIQFYSTFEVDNNKNYVIACFWSTKYYCLLTYNQSSDADFVCTIRFTAADSAHDRVFIRSEPPKPTGIPADIVYWPDDREVAFHCLDWNELHSFLTRIRVDSRLMYNQQP